MEISECFILQCWLKVGRTSKSTSTETNSHLLKRQLAWKNTWKDKTNMKQEQCEHQQKQLQVTQGQENHHQSFEYSLRNKMPFQWLETLKPATCEFWEHKAVSDKWTDALFLWERYNDSCYDLAVNQQEEHIRPWSWKSGLQYLPKTWRIQVKSLLLSIYSRRSKSGLYVGLLQNTL